MKQNEDDRSVLQLETYSLNVTTTKNELSLTGFTLIEVTEMLQEMIKMSYSFRKQKNYFPSVRPFFQVSYSNFL